MRRRWIVSTALLSIALPLLWSLDANLLLLIYDAHLTRSAGSVLTTGSGGDGIARRAFPPGSTPFDGKTVWITGASSGIGAELALQLSSAGAGHLILSGRRRERLESVAKDCLDASKETIRQFGGGGDEVRVSVVPFDMLSDPEVLDEAVSAAVEAASPSGIDVLVLNAGQYQLSPALETDLDVALPDLMRLNFASPVQLSQKLMRRDRWKERGYGHIVTVASLMGRGASPLNALYSATKHALRGYFHSLAGEERSWLRVDVVLPGATDTGLWTVSSKKGIIEKAVDADDRSKMSVHRCAQLMISGMMGPNAIFFETWITRNPGLLWVYLASHEPTTFHWMVKDFIGPIRVDMWRRTGEDALYLPTLLGHAWSRLADYLAGRSERLFE